MEIVLFLLNTSYNKCSFSQVDYDNHALYKHGKTGRRQSPVRIFTNLSPSVIVLPAEEGYRYVVLKVKGLTERAPLFLGHEGFKGFWDVLLSIVVSNFWIPGSRAHFTVVV